MIRYLFTHRRMKKSRYERDEVDVLIDKIERFAPRMYRSDREAYYYNYRMMGAYSKPLVALLKSLSQPERLQTDLSGFTHEVFLKLKAFYDPKDRLSTRQARRDKGLEQKMRQVFILFFDQKDFSQKKWMVESDRS